MSASSPVQLSLWPMSGVGASPARTSAPPTPLDAGSTESAPASGSSSGDSSRKHATSASNREASSSRTSVDSLGGAWTSWRMGCAASATRWRSRASSPPMWERLTFESGASSCALWPTPTGPGGTNQGGMAGRAGPVRPQLAAAVRLAWATPRASDSRGPGPSSTADGSPPLTVQVKGWPTPTSEGNRNRAGLRPSASARPSPPSTARPRSSADAKGVRAHGGRDTTTPGESLNSAARDWMTSEARTVPPLNPEWVGSLMGFPGGWLDLDPAESGRLRAERRNAPGKRRVRSPSATTDPGS